VVLISVINFYASDNLPFFILIFLLTYVFWMIKMINWMIILVTLIGATKPNWGHQFHNSGKEDSLRDHYS
jgi:hypothetical protein